MLSSMSSQRNHLRLTKAIAEIAVCLPLEKTFHYIIPETMKESIQIGMRVLVPFGGRKITGFVIDLLDQPPKELEEKLKEIEAILDEAPLIDPQMLRFYRWISDYYIYPLGEVIKSGIPPGLQLKSKWMLSLTQEGKEAILRGNLDPNQEKVLMEIEKHRRISLKTILKIFKNELSRSQIFLLKKKKLINFEAGIEGKTIKPKIEKIIKYENENSFKVTSKKQQEILNWIKEKGEVFYSELIRHFKSPSLCLRSLKAKGCISIYGKEVSREIKFSSELKAPPRPELTPNQKIVFGEILKGIQSKKFYPFLIYGVTGSGKTEIYLRAIEEVLKTGREAIVLVPEISLTPQLISRFKDRFGDIFSLLHSGLSRGERFDQWRRIWKAEVKIAIGPRSAIFAPFKNLGIIIVDEEHDPSYKQEDKLKYHARDIAVVRAKQQQATLILGSATPSLESFYNALKGKFRLLYLPERIEGRPLPHVEIIDMKKEHGIFSERLRSGMKENLEKKRQGLLFLNRRGFANFILCPQCGFTFKCPNCSVTLTFHLQDHILKCHYCDYRIRAPGDCPQCGGHRLQTMGMGTERLEEELKRLFPEARIERMDRDTTSRKNSHIRILEELESGKIDFLVGTQMIVKGHDFPNVTFVGVISADTSLHFPDFRSAERTFQLLTQVAGRAGRGEIPGEVLIQTFNPEHYSIQKAKEHDFWGFYREEIKFRKALDYPPFSYLVNFRLTGNSEKKTMLASREMEEIGFKLLNEDSQKGIELLGPTLAPLAKIKGKYRWQMLAKGKDRKALHQFAKSLAKRLKPYLQGRGVNLDIDVDPIFIL